MSSMRRKAADHIEYENGRNMRRLVFSSHAAPDTLERFYWALGILIGSFVSFF